MTGDVHAAAELPEGSGVIPRAVAQIFNHLESIGGSTEYSVKCCFLELYNEEITDLLTMSTGSDAPKVRILEDRSGVVMQGLEEPHVKTAADIFSLLETGNARRRTAETLLNKQSSRSHSVFIVTVSVREVLAEGEEVIRVGKLYLVDLAGSENVSRSGAVDQRAKEAGNINKSLLTLGRVITALVEGQGHVPYRDSKLTRLLRDSLGGKTKTCIIATIAPTVQCQEETMSTLDYAHRAKNIKNKPEVNQKISKTTHLKEFAAEIAKLKAELVATRNKNGVFLPPDQYQQECEERQALAARVEELEEESATAATRNEEERAALVSEWEGRVAEVRGELDETRAQLDSTRTELEAAKRAISERDFLLEAHSKAEAALASHAATLNTELAAAAADVAQLFRRVDAKNEVEDANTVVVADFSAAATSKLSALEAAVATAAGDQAERFAAARTALGGISERKAAAGKALEHHRTDVRQRITDLSAAAETATTALASAGDAALNGLGDQHTAFFKLAQAAAAEASSALDEAYSALSSSAQEEKAALETLLTGQTSAAAALHGATTTIVSAVQASLEAAQTQTAAAHAAVETSLAAQAAAAETLRAEFSVAARKGQTALLSQVSALIAGFVENAEGQVETAVSGMKATLAADQDTLHSEMATVAATLGSGLQHLAANAAAAEAAQVTVSDELQGSGARLAAALEASVSHADDVHGASRDHATAAAAALAKHSKAVAAAVKKEAKALGATADKATQKVAEAAEYAISGQEGACAVWAADISADTEAVDGLDAHITTGAGALSSFASTQTKEVKAVHACVHHDLVDKHAVDAARDEVPAVRERTVPSCQQIDALRAPPREVLLNEFRAANDEDELQCSAAMMEENDEDVVEECVFVKEADVELENEVPEDDDVALLAAATTVSRRRKSVAAAAHPLSPSTTVGQKRGRSSGDDGFGDGVEPSPSKLRAAFVRGERRRVTRHT